MYGDVNKCAVAVEGWGYFILSGEVGGAYSWLYKGCNSSTVFPFWTYAGGTYQC